MTAEHHEHRDPLLDAPKKKKLSTGAMVGIGISVVVHVLAGFYLYKSKFELQEFDYVDEAVDVELMAPPAPPRPSVITNPQWARPPRPTERDFPQRALDRGVGGSATVECTVTPSGRPEACRVVSEEPSGMGFGAAAVRIVQRGQLSPRTVDGAATNAKFVVRVPFNLD
ncbi:energy transducer TonB [Brevundimonas diminuta]|uniref:energy transducer TonB n=1 Tax=Brevundimonas diminuta TaxID=293 RepID=UPI0019053DB4|nr:energy transducer TonB [Brevundimonas diminuta]MBK1968261.1 energy transducer TonB [Brevundimonas diminuta]